jgi:hypothetical protein
MTRRIVHRLALVTALLAPLSAPACGGGGAIAGTYESGMYRLTLYGGGKATFRLMDTDFECTYTDNDNSITLSCPARDPVNITFNNDGSLVDPFIGVMKKLADRA